jgi:hypothetical protein
MTVAALVLGIVGTVLAAGSLCWNIIAFVLQGERPKLTAVVGVHSDEGLWVVPATYANSHSAQRIAEEFTGPLVIGVRVTNSGRPPFHVAGWAIQSNTGDAKFVPEAGRDGPVPSPGVPHDIPPGGEATFLTELKYASILFDVVAAGQCQARRVRISVSSGGRDRFSDPIDLQLLQTIAATRGETGDRRRV